MNRMILILITNFVFCSILNAQTTNGTIDTVYSFTPGEGQNTGQAPEYFPENIFGLPDSAASENVPAASAEKIVSLGLDGEIIVGFKDYEIIDRPGADFTIFENAFLNPITQKIFAEPAKVAVSSDGVNFVEFPFDSASLEGCAGVMPTYGGADPFNPSVSGGDSFDLADVGMDKITHIRITDICRMILDNPDHEYYDAVISGFDLDAVAGLHLEERSASAVDDKFNNNFDIKISNNYLSVETHKSYIYNNLLLCNISGNILDNLNFNNEIQVDLSGLAAGAYFIIIKNDKGIIFKKFIKE